MKALLFVSVMLATLTSFADQNIDVYGRGSAQSYCRGNDYFCAGNIKDQAERQANQEAQWNCYNRRGQPLTYTSFCSTTCNPAYVPPDTDTWVTCNTQCRMTCSIPQ